MSHDKNHNKEIEEKMFQKYLNVMRKKYIDGLHNYELIIKEFNSHKEEYDEIKNWLWSNNVRELEDIYKLQERLR